MPAGAGAQVDPVLTGALDQDGEELRLGNLVRQREAATQLVAERDRREQDCEREDERGRARVGPESDDDDDGAGDAGATGASAGTPLCGTDAGARSSARVVAARGSRVGATGPRPADATASGAGGGGGVSADAPPRISAGTAHPSGPEDVAPTRRDQRESEAGLEQVKGAPGSRPKGDPRDRRTGRRDRHGEA